MKKNTGLKLCLFIWGIICSFCVYAQTVQLINVQYFSGDRFVQYPELFLINGKISFNKPKSIDTVIDLTGKYVPNLCIRNDEIRR